jgi:hypothetical protein
VIKPTSKVEAIAQWICNRDLTITESVGLTWETLPQEDKQIYYDLAVGLIFLYESK